MNVAKIIFNVVVVSMMVLFSMFSYTHEPKQHNSIAFFLENPEQYHGILAENSGYVKDIKDGSFVMESNNGNVVVVYNGSVRKVPFGLISVVGTYNKAGYIEAKQIHYHDYGNMKYVLSFVAFIFLILSIFKEWKLTVSGFEERKNA